jgi:hypothetical protein
LDFHTLLLIRSKSIYMFTFAEEQEMRIRKIRPTIDLLQVIKANIQSIAFNIENHQDSDDLEIIGLRFNRFEIDLTIDLYHRIDIKKVDIWINDGEEIKCEIINKKEAEHYLNHFDLFEVLAQATRPEVTIIDNSNIDLFETIARATKPKSI